MYREELSIKGHKDLEQFGQKTKSRILTSHCTKTNSRQIPEPTKQNMKLLIKYR